MADLSPVEPSAVPSIEPPPRRYWEELAEVANAVPDMHGRQHLKALVREGLEHAVGREERLAVLSTRLEDALGSGTVEKTLYEQAVANGTRILLERNQIAAAFTQVYNICTRLKGHVTSHAGRMLLHLVLSNYKIEVRGNGVAIPEKASK